MRAKLITTALGLLAFSACKSDLGSALSADGNETRVAMDDDADDESTRSARDEPTGMRGDDDGMPLSVGDDGADDDSPVQEPPMAEDDDPAEDGSMTDDDLAADDDLMTDDDSATDDELPIEDDELPIEDDSGDDDSAADDELAADDDLSADDGLAVDDTPSDDDTEPGDSALCGNAVVEGAEACDDGVNDGSYGGCNPDCTVAAHCGDGAVDSAHEACDDGNTLDRDGCARDCSDWFDRDFTRRTRLDVENPAATDLVDFPLLVRLDDASIDWAEMGTAEPCFVGADGAPLAYEKDVWTPGTEAIAWVRVPSLGSGTNQLWLYYGGSDDQGCAAGAAWAEKYRGVFHLNDARDSSSYGHSVEDEGTTDAAGVIGRGRTVGRDRALVGPSDPSLQISGDLTISAWVRFSSLDSGSYRNSIVTYGDPDFAFATNFQYGLYLTSNTSLFSYWSYDDAVIVQNTSSATTGMPLGEFHHLAMVRDTAAGVMHYYYDGVEVGTPQAYAALPNGGDLSHLSIGGNAASSSYNMSGVLDEVRILAWAAPGEWLAAEYASMASGIVSASMDP